MSAKRCIAGMLIIVLLAIGAAGAWLYFGCVPKKAPFRARQVIAVQIPQILPTCSNPRSIKRAADANTTDRTGITAKEAI